MQARAIAMAIWLLPVSGPADRHDVARRIEEGTVRELAQQPLLDKALREVEAVEFLRRRQLGDRQLVLDRARLLVRNLRRQQRAEDPLRGMAAPGCVGEHLVVDGLHAFQAERAHQFQDVLASHSGISLRLS